MSAAVVRRGRPRSEEIDAAILEATLAELAERGFVAMSMEGIAYRAGVAKTTLYRRWDNTTELAVEALRGFEAVVDDPPPGTVRQQLAWLLEGMRRKWNDPHYSEIMRRAAADAGTQPEVYREARDRLIAPHIRRMNAVLRRGVDEGLIRADVDLGWARHMLAAPILAAAFTRRERVSAAQIEQTLDIALRGLAPTGSAS